MPHVNLLLGNMPLDSPQRVEHAGKKLVVIRSAEGVFAYEDSCPHAFWPLSEGTVGNCILECPGHGWEFSVATGQCLNAPAYRLTPVAVAVLGDTIRLEWEDVTTARR
jgi:nitrite reductase/ring-hydroxylating ferredoxin subunit